MKLRGRTRNVLICLVAVAAAYIVLGLPSYIQFESIDINSGRERTVGTLFGFAISREEHDTDTSQFILRNCGNPLPPEWHVYQQWRPFDSTRRCYFFSSSARIAYKDLLIWFEEMKVPQSEQVRLMQAAIKIAQSGDWLRTFVEDDSLGVGPNSADAPTTKWVRDNR